MFAPDQERAARELLRVCRHGGRIGLASWTPDGFIGQMFKVVGSARPPPAGLRGPALWGTEARLDELSGGVARNPHPAAGFSFRYRSAAHWLEVFRTGTAPPPRVRGPRARRSGRPWRPTSLALVDAQRGARRDDGGPERLPRGRDHAAVRTFVGGTSTEHGPAVGVPAVPSTYPSRIHHVSRPTGGGPCPGLIAKPVLIEAAATSPSASRSSSAAFAPEPRP